jgi:hypothetical protein
VACVSHEKQDGFEGERTGRSTVTTKKNPQRGGKEAKVILASWDDFWGSKLFFGPSRTAETKNSVIQVKLELYQCGQVVIIEFCVEEASCQSTTHLVL